MRSKENIFYVGFGALILLTTSLPYIFGWLYTPPGRIYTGLAYNIDDAAVYLSWMHQSAEGNFFLHNRFTTEPQKGILFNFFFWILGNFSRFVAPILVYHAARVFFGGLLLWAIVRLLHETIENKAARMTAFALTCTAAGFGWFQTDYNPARGYEQPIDLWQPEAITFLSLYNAPLFSAALAAMVWFIASFLRAEKSQSVRDLVPALVCGFLLGNFHSYDVIHLFAVVLVYRLITDLLARKIDREGWLRLIYIGAAMLPTTLYQAYVLRAESVFYDRAFATFTHSPSLWWILLGFGLPLLCAFADAVRRWENIASDNRLRLLIVWAVVGIAVSYLPVSFQRKMLMGAQIPFCLLAAQFLVFLTLRLSGDFPKIALGLAVLLAMPSNALFLLRDIERLKANIGSTEHHPYLTVDEAEALNWLSANGKPGDIVLCAPNPNSHKQFPGFALRPYLSVFVPAQTSCTVYNGHWSETVDYNRKHNDAIRFYKSDTDDTFRRDFLKTNDIRYLLVPNNLAVDALKDAHGMVVYAGVDWMKSVPDYLSVAYRNANVTVYRVP